MMRVSRLDRKKQALPCAGVVLLLVCIILTLMPVKAYAAKARISEKNLVLFIGETKALKVSGTAKKIQWRSLKKGVAAVSSGGKVVAKKVGRTTITAQAGKKILKCSVTVKKPDSARRSQMAMREAKRIVKKYITSDMSTVERAYVLSSYLTDNCAWQKNQTDAAYKKNYGNEAYAALVLKKAACSGYAKAYMILCKLAKVPVKHINANMRTHQWNMVKVNGRWLKVDTYGGTFESTKGIRKSILDRETYNEDGKKERVLFRFKIKI